MDVKIITYILLTLNLLIFCNKAASQDLIITKQGDLFQCEIGSISAQSIPFSFTYEDRVYHDTIEAFQVAWHGKDFSSEIRQKSDDEFLRDLIITQKGEILSCRILSPVIINSIEYAFLVNGQEMKNVIRKKDVAYYARSIKSSLDPQQESRKYFNSLAVVAAGQQASAINSQDLHYTDYVEEALNKNEGYRNLDYSSNNGQKNLIVTMDGRLFLCEITSISDYFIPYIFTYKEFEFYDTIATKDVAWYGKDFISKQSGRTGSEYQQDLIITKKGELLTCKIESYIASNNIEYAFLVNQQEMRNTIRKKDVAYFTKSFSELIDLERESLNYYSSLAIVTEHAGLRAEMEETQRRQDSLSASTDLIVTVDGQEMACAIRGYDMNSVQFEFFRNGTVMENAVDKSLVKYLLKDYNGQSPEKIVITPDPETPNDFTMLIITSQGATINCFIHHVGLNTIEYYVKDGESAAYRIIRKSEVLYFGEDFLDKLDPDILAGSKFRDMIVTKNGDVLVCNIESETSAQVRYSFELNKMKLESYLKKNEIIYSGRNFYRNPELLAQEVKDVSEKEVVGQDESKKEVAVQRKAEESDHVAPDIIIVSPALAGETTFEAVSDEVATLRVTGVVVDKSGINRLLINNQESQVGANGKFSMDLDLETGTNQISISATDIHENVASVKYSIERHKPVEMKKEVIARDTRAPEITLAIAEMNPADKTVSVVNSQKTIEVVGNVLDQTGVYEVLVNGRDAVLLASGEFSREVLLRVGENRITIQATDLELNSSTETLTVLRRDAVAAASFSQPDIVGPEDKYYALIIGVNSYPDPYLNNLNGHPTSDAKELSELLINHYSFEEEDVTLLLDPKRVDILKSFDILSKEISTDDNLLIFFAGHGYYNKETNLGYWLPSDAESEYTYNWIYNNVLVDNLKRIRSKHTLLISDACFSGSIFKTRSMNFGGAVAYQRKYDLPSRKAITSGAMEAVPMESVFFKFLIDRLQNNDAKYMSAGELFRSLEFPVTNSSDNAPQYGTIQNVNDEGGDFIFIRK